MSTSKSKRKPTKAGVALTAAARNKLQQVARWMADELVVNQDPAIRLGYHGGVATSTSEESVTYLTPIGVLVQMFDPFKTLADMKQLRWGVYVADFNELNLRAAAILDLSFEEYLTLMKYLYFETWMFHDIIKRLRNLK